MISVNSHITNLDTYKFDEMRRLKLNKDIYLDMAIRYLNKMIIQSKIDIKLTMPVKEVLEETC